MQKSNTSAQLAGSSLNKFMSYVTTVTDVSQAAPESVGNAMKTLYSRFGNVKAGKFVAGAGEESDGEEFEALNDIEKVLNKIGISMRDTSAEFRNFDDVLADIAAKWATLSDVERNAISTAFAGTRQREVFSILLENYDQVGKFENIAENSEGSTQEKMDIYGDSLEAAKNRRTAAVEELTQNFNILGMDGTDILTKWNDLLTYIIKNWKEIIGFLATVTILGKGLLSGSMFGGLVKLMQSLTVSAANFSNTMQTIGSNLYNSPIMGMPLRAIGEAFRKPNIQSTSDVMPTTSKYGRISVNPKTTPEPTNVLNKPSAQTAYVTKGNQILGDMKGESPLSSIRTAQNRLVKEKLQPQSTSQQSASYGQRVLGPLWQRDGQGAGWQSNALTQVQDIQSQNVYGAAFKAGQSVGLDAVQSDRLASFYKGMSADDAKWWSSLSAAQQEELIGTYGDDSIEQQQLNATRDLINALRENTQSNKQDAVDDGDGTPQNSQNRPTNSTLTNADHERAQQMQKKGRFAISKSDANANTLIRDNKKLQQEQAKQAKLNNLTSAATGAVAMGTMAVTSMITANSVDQEDTGEKIGGTVATMAPMIGMMFGPWGAVIGSAVGVISALITKFHKTDAEKRQEIIDQAKEANEKLDKHYQAIEENNKKSDELEDIRSRFMELSKGVNMTTQTNLSLDTSEWEEYQGMLEKIIDSSDRLYKSYDSQGNIIAKSADGLTDFTDILNSSLDDVEEDTQQHAKIIMSATAARVDSIQGAIQAVKDANPSGSETETDWGMNDGEGYGYWDYFTGKAQGKAGIGRTASSTLVSSVGVGLGTAGGIAAGGAIAAGLASAKAGAALGASLGTAVPVIGNIIGGIIGAGVGMLAGAGISYAVSESKKNGIEKMVRKGFNEGKSLDDIKKEAQDKYGGTWSTTDIDTAVANIYDDQNNQELLTKEIDQTYSKEIAADMKTKALATDGYSEMSDSNKEYLNNLFDTLDNFTYYERNEDGSLKTDKKGNYIEKNQQAITRDLNQTEASAEQLTKWAATNSSKVSYLSNFDANNATEDDWNNYNAIISDMTSFGARSDLNNDGIIDAKDMVDGKYVMDAEMQKQLLEGQGYSVDDSIKIQEVVVKDKKGNIKYDSAGNAIKEQRWVDSKGNVVENIDDYIKDRRETLWGDDALKNTTTALKKNGLSHEDFSYGELQLLSKYRGDTGVQKLIEDGANAREIIAELQKLNLGENAQASEYFSLLTAEVENFSGKTEDLVDVLNDVENQGLFSVQMLREFADNLDMIEADGTISDEFGTAMEFLGDINIGLMTTSKTLAQVQDQYQTINDAISDINDNGKISAENLEKVLDAYPNLIQYLGDTDTLMKHLNEGQATQGTKIIASLKGKITGNNDALSGYINGNDSDKDGAFNGLVNDDDKEKLTMFGNLDAMANTTSRLYKKDDDGNWVLEDRYQNMKLEEDDYSKNSWAKVIAENVFDIDTTKDKDTVDSQLEKAMQEAAIASGMKKNDVEKMTRAQLLEIYQGQLENNPAMMMAQQNVLDAQAQVNAIKAAMDLEDENIKQQINDYVSRIKSQYSSGDLSSEQYINGLNNALYKLEKQGNATKEELAEIREEIEDTKFDNLTEQFEEGAVSAAKFNEELSKMAKNNVVGEEDWEKAVEAAIGANDQLKELNDKNISMLEMDSIDDFATKRGLQQSNIDLAQKKLAEIKAAGELEHGASYNPESDPKYIAAKEELYGELKEYSEIFDEQKSFLESELDKGYIGQQEYIDSLKAMRDSGELTAEQLSEFGEAIEDAEFELAKINFTEGKMTGAEYRSEVMKKIQNNKSGSEDERSAIQEYLSSYDTEVSISETKASLLAENDFAGKTAYLTEDINTLTESLAFMEAAGLQNSEQYYKNTQRIVEKKKEQLELEKQRYEYEVKKSGEVLDAYSNIISYGMNELKKRQEDINDMYDDEISKLQDINDQKQRSIELTKLEQELENAKKEKVRVYTAGIGFTYQQNKAKVKEAQQNLNKFNDEQKISDLKHAQEAQNKLIEDEIKRLQDIQDYISGIKQTAEVTASLMDLKKNDIVPQNATISDAINQITQSAVNGVDGHVISLGTQFQTYSDSYTANSALLNQYNDEIEGKLQAISDAYTTYSQYVTDKELVADLSAKIDAKTRAADSPATKTSNDVSTIASKLTKLIGDRDFNTFVTDFKKNFGSITVSNLSELDVTPPDYSGKLDEANEHLKAMQAALHLQTTAKTTSSNKGERTVGTLQDKNTKQFFYRFMMDGKEYFTTVQGKAGSKVEQGSQYWTREELEKAGYSFSSGIENGPVTYTGLAMLHGSPSSPEYVLNSKQAGTLLKNLATISVSKSESSRLSEAHMQMQMAQLELQLMEAKRNLYMASISPYQAPKISSYNGHGNCGTTYQFYGDMNLPNVQRPDQFFNELLKQANVQFPTIKENYR